MNKWIFWIAILTEDGSKTMKRVAAIICTIFISCFLLPQAQGAVLYSQLDKSSISSQLSYSWAQTLGTGLSGTVSRVTMNFLVPSSAQTTQIGLYFRETNSNYDYLGGTNGDAYINLTPADKDIQKDFVFNFANPITLNPNSYYYLYITTTYNDLYVYGSSDSSGYSNGKLVNGADRNLPPSGWPQDTNARDAYFKLDEPASLVKPVSPNLQVYSNNTVTFTGTYDNFSNFDKLRLVITNNDTGLVNQQDFDIPLGNGRNLNYSFSVNLLVGNYTYYALLYNSLTNESSELSANFQFKVTNPPGPRLLLNFLNSEQYGQYLNDLGYIGAEGGNVGRKVAQSITFSDADRILTSVDLKIRRKLGSDGVFVKLIRQIGSGSPGNGELIATSDTFSWFTNGTIETVNFPFPSKPTLLKGETYFIVLEATQSFDNPNQLRWDIFLSDQNYNGADDFLWTTYGYWIPQSGNDLAFRLWGDTEVIPVVGNLGQFKSDGTTPLDIGGTTTEGTVNFQATVTSPSNNQVSIGVQVLDPSNNVVKDVISSPVPSGSIASVSATGLSDGQYHWRARAVDSQSNSSSWQAFGTPGSTDFVVHQVPLYTQVESDFPSRTQTILWSKVTDIYGTGNYKDCKDPISNLSTIRSCGCAITSSVMALRFYIVRPASGEDVNPKTINDWLKLNSGYSSVGDLVWPQLVAYSGGSLSYKFSDKDSDLLNSELAAGHPVILAESTTDPGKAGHFIVADGQLAQTYTIRDPRWYKTRFLTQAVADIQTERNYSNNFLSMRLLTPVIGQNIVPDAIYVSLASPAEFLITDPNGRRLGKDPVTGVSFNEIPDGAYYREGISGGTPENPTPPHESKIVWIPTPATGQYNLQVIGTGNGSYTLDSLIYDAQGNTHPQIFTGIAETNLVTDFNLNFTPNQPENIVVKPADKIPPEAKIFFDKDNKHVKVEGVDNITQPGPSVERQNNLYTIRDAAENILKLSFEKVKQEGREIKAELESLQYNIQPIIELPKTDLKFEWSVDKDTQQIKKLKQNIEVRNQFEIKAKYNLQKNETEIKIERGRGKERELSKQALPGLVIIKLTTKSGALDFEF